MARGNGFTPAGKPKPKRKPPGNARARKAGVQWRTKEVSVEDHLREQVQRAGGFCIKLPADLAAGIPDRLVILPNYVLFVELKRPFRGRVSVTQKWWHDRLRDMGHYSAIIRTKAEVDELMRIYG